jgi:16S rRNA (cytosine1402-N4)-methyltransferase
MDRAHVPVLVKEVVEWIHGKDGGVYVDATIGSGGHAAALLDRYPGIALLVGIDRDAQAVARAKKNLAAFHKRAAVVHGNFSTIKTILDKLHIERIDGIIFDLGVSSMQLSDPVRGFSFMTEGPLDRGWIRTLRRAQDLVNTLSASALEEIFVPTAKRWARNIARAIQKHRLLSPYPPPQNFPHCQRAIPAGIVFIHSSGNQNVPLRMAVNNELENLDHALMNASC